MPMDDEGTRAARNLIRYGVRCGISTAYDQLEARARLIEADGEASVFAGPVISELRRQAKLLRELHAKMAD